jgi:mono/diheme cytochrome c family protein
MRHIWRRAGREAGMTEMQCDRMRAGMESRAMRRALIWLIPGNFSLAAALLLAASASAQENRLPPGPGREAVIAACSDCHGLVALYGKQMNYGTWYAIIGDMINNGASVPQEDREAIADYLATNFGPPQDPAAAK